MYVLVSSLQDRIFTLGSQPMETLRNSDSSGQLWTITMYSKLQIICVQIICAWLFLHKHGRMWARLLSSFRTVLSSLGCVCVSTEDMVEQYLSFSMLYCQYRWWGEEVCSSGHGGGEREDTTGAWSFSHISVLQSVLLCFTVHQLSESGS
jgi:hypothetical protein